VGRSAEPLRRLPAHQHERGVVVEVPIKTKGPSKGEAEGGILVVQMDQVRVRCLPFRIPDQIDVDIRALLRHDSIHVKDLVLPKGVEAADGRRRSSSRSSSRRRRSCRCRARPSAPIEPELITKPPKPGEEEEGAAAPEAGADKKGAAAPAARRKRKK
jgi:hypothetical protein